MDVRKVNMKEFNDGLIKIWEDEFGKPGESNNNVLAPMLYPDLIESPDILFVGINPSFKIEDVLQIFLDNPRLTEEQILNNTMAMEFYRWNSYNYTKNKSKVFRDVEKIAKQTSGYYNVFNKFPGNWEHVDLFNVREMSQKILMSQIFINKSKLRFNSFAEKNLELNIRIIEKLKPKIIIIANAKASDIFRSIDKDKLKIRELGCSEWEGVPVFLCGMLSRQRALDIYSRERLIWHVEYVCAKKGIKLNNDKYSKQWKI